MKKYLSICFSALCVVCCSPAEPTLEQKALNDKFAETIPTITKVNYSRFEKIDSTTLGTEIDNRIALFETKNEVNKRHYEKYVREKKMTNANLKSDEIYKGLAVIEFLDSLKADLGPEHLSDIAYYDYKFTATVRYQGGYQELTDYYACITPDGKVLGYTNEIKNLHKGCGSSIPGYVQALKDEPEE